MPKKNKHNLPAYGRGETPKRRKKGSHLPILREDKETVFQMYAAGYSKSQIAVHTNISRPTVNKILAEYTPAQLNLARADAALEMTGKMTRLAETAMESIQPSDFERASLSQKAVAAGIFVDKSIALDKLRRDLSDSYADATAANGIPLPNDAQGMIRLLANKIKQVEVLRVELRDPEGESVISRAQELMKSAETAALLEDEDIVEAEYEELNIRNPHE